MTIASNLTKVNIMTDTAHEAEKILSDVLSSRVAALRRKRSVSLDALAKEANLSKGTVVAIENGDANPSISVLCRLAAALSVSVSDLVNGSSDDRNGSSIELTTPKQLWVTKKGSEAVLQAAVSGSTMFELWLWTLKPGDVYEADGHSLGTTELITVQTGCLEVVVGGETQNIGTGGAAILRTDQPHIYRAIGQETAMFTMAVLELGRARVG